MSTPKHVEVICAACGELRIHAGRWLCVPCYRALLRRGALHRYPPVGAWVATAGRIEDYLELAERGYSRAEIAERLGVSLRTVERYARKTRRQQRKEAAA